MTQPTLPRDDLIRAADEVKIRQRLVRVALGHIAADIRLRVGKLLDVHALMWLTDQEIVISGRRIAYVGPAGTYPGEVLQEVHVPDLMAVPGFGEVHKHIESSHVAPEWRRPWSCRMAIHGPARRAMSFPTSTGRERSISG